MDAPRRPALAELVPCPPLHAVLFLRSCLLRHVAAWPSGRRAGHARFPGCAACPLGARRLRANPWFEPPPPTQPAEVLEPAQRAARERWARSWPEYREPLEANRDVLHLAARLTPDDPWIAVDYG